MRARFLPVSGRTALTVLIACALALCGQRNVPGWWVPVQVFADWYLAWLLVLFGGEAGRRALYGGSPKVLYRSGRPGDGER